MEASLDGGTAGLVGRAAAAKKPDVHMVLGKETLD